MSTPPDPFEFVKQLWGQMAVPGFGLTGNPGPAAGGMQMPSFDPKELEKRLAELKQVKQWLEMNLSMMGLQINALEMQLAGLNGLSAAATKAFGDHAANTVGAGGSQPGAAAPNAPWMDPQTWMNFMQQQAAATQTAVSQAMQDGTQAMQQAAQSAATAAATAATTAAATAAPSRAPNPAATSPTKRATKSAAPKRAPPNKSV